MLLGGCSKQKQPAKTQQKAKTVKIVKKTDPIKARIKRMSLSEKIGQLYIAHSHGNFQQMLADVQRYHLGGICLYGSDFQGVTPAEFRQRMQTYQLRSTTGLLLATDEEGGKVTRIPDQWVGGHFERPQIAFQQGGLSRTQLEAGKIAASLHELGINVDYAPVVDVSPDRNSYIYPRTLGADYQTTAAYSYQTVKTMQKHHVGATLKHFPGYGDAGDTHHGFATLNKPLAAYQKQDLLPFKSGIKAGTDEIMVSHIVIKNLDPLYPASLSAKTHQYLRDQMHYQGVITTDDLGMGAVLQFAQTRGINPDLKALEAGNDLLLGGNYQANIPIIKKAVVRGQLPEKKIDQALERVLKLKQKLGVLILK